MPKTVVGLYRDFDTAEDVVRDLVDNGFRRDDISLIAQDRSHGRQAPGGFTESANDEDTGSHAASGAGAGAVLGGLAGLLVGLGALAIPGVGPIIAAGPLATTLAGAGIGAVAGGLIGALTEAGVPEDEARAYAEGVRSGGTLVTLRAPDEEAGHAVDIMNRHHPIDINDRTQQWAGAGTQATTPAATSERTASYTSTDLAAQQDRQMAGQDFSGASQGERDFAQAGMSDASLDQSSTRDHDWASRHVVDTGMAQGSLRDSDVNQASMHGGQTVDSGMAQGSVTDRDQSGMGDADFAGGYTVDSGMAQGSVTGRDRDQSSMRDAGFAGGQTVESGMAQGSVTGRDLNQSNMRDRDFASSHMADADMAQGGTGDAGFDQSSMSDRDLDQRSMHGRDFERGHMPDRDLAEHDFDERYAPSPNASQMGASAAGAPAFGQGQMRGGDDFSSFDRDFRNHYDMVYASSGQDYNYYEPGYRYGYDLAGMETLQGRSWNEIEPNARRQWEQTHADLPWSDFRDAVRHGWERVASTGQDFGSMRPGSSMPGNQSYGTGMGEGRFTDPNNP